MNIVDFAQFARRRSADQSAAQSSDARLTLPQTDRWAMLHTAVQDVAPARDFWSDLQLRMAYPTYHFRHH